MPIHGDKNQLILRRPHNHPPDSDMEERNAFIGELKFFAKAMKNAPLKKVYDTAALRYSLINLKKKEMVFGLMM